jgi:TonB-linked SusC/RagA family outer membrane protein
VSGRARALLRASLVSAFTLLPTLASSADAQAFAPAAAQSAGTAPAAASNALQRPVTLVAGVIRLGDALAAIAAQADLALVYGSDAVPVDRQVRVRFDGTPAGEALRTVLADVDVDFVVERNRQVVLTRRRRPAAPPAAAQEVTTGTVAGRIVDAESGAPVAAADVWLDGTRWRTQTATDGRFVLASVAEGEYTLRVRRIGYTLASQAVTVRAGETASAEVRLRHAPTKLDDVVVTVTGDQRVRELGHVVGRINADSLVKNAPVSSLSQLLTGRVPGLQVFSTSGTVGGEVSLRVRAANSMHLSADPIVIVDGVRYSGGTGYEKTNVSVGAFNVEPTSRMNDINPNDIESIEVVKGPSAATLYGTDAANGVIVITTKRGRPGPARWNAYARAGLSEIPTTNFSDAWWGWSSSTTNCTLQRQGQGLCAQDSVTVIPNPLNDPELTIFGPKPQWEYGASVAGGNDVLRYFFSADFEEATGPVRLPSAMVDELKERVGGGTIPKSQLEPITMDRLNLRANVSADLGERATVRVNLGYTQGETLQMAFGNPFSSSFSSVNPGEGGYAGNGPIGDFARSSTEWVNRFTASTMLEWRPLGWLQTRATLGLDLPNTHRYSLALRDAWANYKGAVSEDRLRSVVTTGELGATASFRPTERITSRTSVGAQYVRSYRDRLIANGTDIRPGGTSVIDAVTVRVQQAYGETVTLGSYFEQVLGFDDRLFLTAAVRADGASTFGNDYKAAFYPKASVSWVVSEEPFMPRIPGLDDLRLRYAYGASGQQPLPDMRRFGFGAGQAIHDGATYNKIVVSRLPSPDLRPERVKEHEFGVDVGAFDERVRLDLTWNRRDVVDQIQTVPMPTGFGSIWTNIGHSTGQGFEAMLNLRPVDLPTVSWDVALTHAHNTTKLRDLGGVPASYTFEGGFVEGYPLGARFMRPLLGYDDANGNGIIEADEITMGDTAVYVGQGAPARSQTLTSTVGLFRQRVRVSAMLDRRSDYMQYNQIAMMQRLGGFHRASLEPTPPLEEQARIMATHAGGAPGQPATGYWELERGDFTRLREVSVGLEVPQRWADMARLDRAQVTLAGRNLALWSRYGGPDPESARFANNFATYANNIPQARNWVLRVDLGF